jgi:tetratricopeptide (TPR) repeat protein
MTEDADQSEAKVALEEALSLIERTDSVRLRAHYFGNLGGFQLAVGDVDHARKSFEESLRLCRLAGAEAMALTNMCNLGDTAWALGNVSEAVVLFRQAVDEIRSTALGRRYQLAHASASLACVLAEQDHVEDGKIVASECASILFEQDLLRTYAAYLALVISKLGGHSDAARLVGFSDTVRRSKHTQTHYNAARARDAAVAYLSANSIALDLPTLFVQGASMADRDIFLLVKSSCRAAQ